MFESDYLAKMDELRTQGFPDMLHYQDPQFVLRDKEILTNAQAIAIAKGEFEIEDAETYNTVIYNRNMREKTFEMMLQLGNPIIFMRFGVEDPRRPKDFEDLGQVEIELYVAFFDNCLVDIVRF
jgi:hypothetical protein